ncbi:hypothetical protein PG994_003533 [Apiospora phragmitis]|uniref:Uncharacterized protein n=1 Tax=Apiospora phragmitis TaxID=2905665 RepID=A0ABR1VYD8_9PEZI
MALPPEVRLNILEYTDLVTPSKEVEWSPRRGLGITFTNHTLCHAASRDTGYSTIRRETQGWQRFTSCQPVLQRLPAAGQPLLTLQDSYQMGAICGARQSGYASRCQCWMPPRALMRVSRAMYAQAIAVLYGRNRVIVVPDDGRILCRRWVEPGTLPAMPGRSTLGAAQFLLRHRALGPAAALSQLRTLELVFPSISTRVNFHLRPETDFVCQNWSAAVRHLREQRGDDLAGLTIIVHLRLAWDSYLRPAMIHPHWKSQVSGRPAHDWSIASVDGRRSFQRYLEHFIGLDGESSSLWKVHAVLLEPLRELRDAGLQRLFVFLESGWRWSPPQGCAPQECRGLRVGEIDEHIKKMEEALEKRVMGGRVR